ncbi:Tox-REase-5 domain-containing protein [Hyalangium gracile]|uniref:Tox-REase-5 domain-containing protein n=1 Tax=Hyalangium gracile TaxID=394092 RepID=UPI001CCE95BA|nr:Tox-REase-5 domain-containing protein [Hyalangium gracile]
MKASREKRYVPRAAKGWAVVVLWAVVAGCASGPGRPPLGGVAMMERLRYRPATPQDAPAPVAASKKKAQQPPPGREGGSGPAGLVARAVMGGLVQVDGFEAVLLLGGLDNLNELPARGEPLTPEEAARLYEVLLGKPVTLAGFGPRLVASYLLREVMEGEEEPEREELLERVKRFRGLAVLRPDGYLAWALTGETQQRVAPVEWKEGAFRAHGFEVGRFYSGRNGMAFFEVDEELRDSRQGGVLAEVYDDADVLSRVMEGAEDAVVELAVAMGRLVSHPLRSVAELEHLPTAVVGLLKSSPEYLERFRRMTRGEQLRVLSKLGTTLLCTYGTAASTARTVGATGRGLEVVSVPALRLTAEGALAVERVAVPVGRVVTALRGGPGAALILQRSNEAARGGQPAAPEGPGQWGPAHEVMSRRAARYQEQISGHAASEAYWVGGKDMKSGGVKLDGFEEGVLLEAKGPGYANKFTDDLAPKPWFKDSGARQLIAQAQRQFRVAQGVPIRWHVAEKKAADAIRKLLKDAEVEGIEVVHTPALQ